MESALKARFPGWHFHAQTAPQRLLFQSSPSHIAAFLAGATPIAEDPDSGAVLVVDWKDGTIASFLFNDAPGDFVIEQKTVENSQLEARYRRAIWLGQLFHGDDWVSDELTLEFAEFDNFERALVSSRADIAAYWLLTYAVLGDEAAFNDVRELSRAHRTPLFVELREALSNVAVLFEQHRPDVDFTEVRAAVRARASGR